jgi:hypothetical protein
VLRVSGDSYPMARACSEMVVESGQVLGRRCLNNALPGLRTCYAHSDAAQQARKERSDARWAATRESQRAQTELRAAEKAAANALLSWLANELHVTELRKAAQQLVLARAKATAASQRYRELVNV